MEKILITGGAGFIGSNLIVRLIKDGYKVTILDNISTGRKENIEKFKDEINFVEGSILDFEVLDKLVRESDAVFHLAAAVGVKYIVNDPLNSIETNVIGSHNVLKVCHKHGKRVIIASSSEVYGKNNEVLSEESDRLLGSTIYTRWNYASSKALDEFLALGYFKKYDLPVTIVRFFNTIGVGQVGSYGMVVPTFVGQALKNEDITIYGDGNQRRCFCDVDNVISGLILLLNNKGTYGQIYNLGTDEEISMNDLAKKIIELTKSSSKIKYVSYEEAYGKDFEDIMRRRPNISKIKKLGYEPTIKLEESLVKVINSVKK